jgi:hypothetical protein
MVLQGAKRGGFYCQTLNAHIRASTASRLGNTMNVFMGLLGLSEGKYARLSENGRSGANL